MFTKIVVYHISNRNDNPIVLELFKRNENTKSNCFYNHVMAQQKLKRLD